MTRTVPAVDLAPLLARMSDPAVGRAYREADPFPHGVFDHAFDDEVFVRAAAEFPARDAPLWNRYLQVNQAKYASTEVERWGPTLQAVAGSLLSEEFVTALGRLTGIDGLLADASMDGGGLHQTLRGGHLNIHCDFTTHHRNPTWRRRVNILLYLNGEWSPGWGGDLEMWDRDVTTMVRAVQPVGNRLLVFTTSSESYHGHPDPLRCPPDMARRSLALYYFTDEVAPLTRATDYRARPSDGLRAVPIWLDARLLRAYDSVKRRFGLSDRLVHGASQRLDRLRRRLGRDGAPPS